MELNVQVEKTSPIQRKLTIKVPAAVVTNRFQRGLAEVQKTANLKGFRPGQAPITMIKQFYGEDVRHRVYHALIDDAFKEAVSRERIPAIGRPQIESPEHQHGAGEHDHSITEDKEFTFTATVEVLPEIDVKGYTGVALTREKSEVEKDAVEGVIKNLLDSQAEMVPVSGGLLGADGKPTSSRPVQKADHVDLTFKGGLVTDNGVEERPGMSGNRMVEVGSDSLIPGFEDNLVGMQIGESKTFRLPFPDDYFEKDMAGKHSEFTVTVNDVKVKKLPELTDELAKEMGYESVADLRTKALEHLKNEKTSQVETKLRSDLIEAIIEKNSFDVPAALVESQTRALAQDWSQELKRQGVSDQVIQQAIMSEVEGLKKRAERQVRASLVLEAIAKKETIEVSAEEFDAEIKKMAAGMKMEEARVREFYTKEAARREDLMFRLRQERTIKYLLDKAKIKG